MVTETNEDGWITYMDGDDLLERARRERALRGPGMSASPGPSRVIGIRRGDFVNRPYEQKDAVW